MHKDRLNPYRFKIVSGGSRAFYAWLIFLVAVIIWGGLGYAGQLREGLITSHMRDSVSWAFYIGNFTIMVGIAAAAVMLVIPAYIYHWKPFKEIVIFGELLAISAVFTSVLFVLVDMGKPRRFWHMIPALGSMNFPSSLLAWDFLFLFAYAAVNIAVVLYLLQRLKHKKDHENAVLMSLVFISIPLAIGIHTVTAFLYSSLAARPFWHTALLAPRFLASAFSSGLALLLILFQVLRRTTNLEIRDDAIWKIGEILVYTIFLYLFFIFSEFFKELYSGTENIRYWKYLLSGIGMNRDLVLFTWTYLITGCVSFILFLVPLTRKNFITLNMAACLIFISVFIEKGVTLILPGFTPDVLGQVYVYSPTWVEIRTALMVYSSGLLLFTLMSKIVSAVISTARD